MNLPRTARAALALIALGTVTPPVAGQPAPPADPVFADVFVADAAGRPVTGVRPGDIEVLEDGAPVPVVSCVGPTQVRGASSDEIARARQLVVALFVDDTATPAECQAVFAKADTVAGPPPPCSSRNGWPAPYSSSVTFTGPMSLTATVWVELRAHV